MKTFRIVESAGEFAEDKDAARRIRTSQLAPALRKGEEVEVSFQGVGLATQSFVHALLSDIIRRQGPGVLDRVVFSDCNSSIQNLIEIVTEYSQESID